MKKLVLALLGVCCAVMIVPAQEVVSADTIKAVPAYATVDQQPVAQEVETCERSERISRTSRLFQYRLCMGKTRSCRFPVRK